jgi:gamma-glutamyltranspeptidase/glutathione hydrolase
MIDFKMDIHEAVSAPRIVGVSNSIDISNRTRHSVASDLRNDGYTVVRSPQAYAFAALHGIQVKDGQSAGAADPQRDGMAISIKAPKRS